jgi:hypothetical protein
MNEKTIADATLDADIGLELAHECNEYDNHPEDEQKEDREYTEQQLKALVTRYLYERRNDNEALFNLLRGVAQVGGFKEQGMGVMYLNGEFATNHYNECEIIHLSYNTCADDEEIENMKQDVDKENETETIADEGCRLEGVR